MRRRNIHMPKSILVGLVLMAGCSGDATGPDLEVPTLPNVAGSWTFDPIFLSGGRMSESITSGSLTLTQSDSTFSGTYTDGVMHWMGSFGCCALGAGSGTVVNGSVTESGSITFDFHLADDVDAPDWHFTGTVTGNSASGTVAFTLDHGGPIGVFTYSGDWAWSR